MSETVGMLVGAARFVGGLLIVFGAVWLALNWKDQNRMTGPVLIMAAGGVVSGMAGMFGEGASGL